ncbi:amino acid permease [Verrucomicrobiota bacterium]|nr:amino acid permease [Verrucomicrobiota bacterium]
MSTARPLGLGSAVALVVASMIGTGVFTTSGFLLGDLGSADTVLAAWAVGGVIAALGALSYGALARRIPESGGEYLFLSRTLHPSAGFLAGWISLLVGFSAPMAAAAMAFGEYTKTWLPGWNPRATGTALIVGLSVLHAVRVAPGAWVQNVAVALKAGLIAAFIGLACGRLPAPGVVEAGAGTGAGVWSPAFAVSLVWVSFSYAGWNAAIYVGGEIRDAERNLPRALLAGALLVTALYLGLNFVFLRAVPAVELVGQLEVGRIAARALGGAAWAEAVTALVALGLLTSVSSMVMAGPRVYARMAADGYLPAWLNCREGAPRAAIGFQLAVALVMLWTATYKSLLTYIGFTLSLSTAATVVGLMRLRRREGASLRVPGWPWVPGLFVASVLWMAVFSVARQPVESALGLATLGVGWVAWWGGWSGKKFQG